MKLFVTQRCRHFAQGTLATVLDTYRNRYGDSVHLLNDGTFIPVAMLQPVGKLCRYNTVVVTYVFRAGRAVSEKIKAPDVAEYLKAMETTADSLWYKALQIRVRVTANESCGWEGFIILPKSNAIRYKKVKYVTERLDTGKQVIATAESLIGG